jgi:undecaprenyl-diphosphatase
MTIFDAIILGLVEGVTEFLPISSTGHLILTTGLLHIAETDFVKTFIIIIQLGAILAAAVLYWRRLLLEPRTLALTIVAFVPTGVIGFLLYKVIKGLLGNPAIVVWSLLVGGVILLLIEWWLRDRPAAIHHVRDISYPQAAVIGACQALSMVPGVSRSAATIMTGLVLGVERKAIVEFSFILAIPTMVAASAYEIYKTRHQMNLAQADLLAVGFVVAFVLAIVSIKFLLRFVQTHTFSAFGVYRIVAAIAFWLIVLSR